MLDKNKQQLLDSVNASNKVYSNEELSILLSEIQEKMKSMEQDQSTILDRAYPVGSIYISYSSTNPSSLFGGTWVAYGTGRTLVGVDTSQTEFNAIGKTGGEKTHTLTIAEMPSHTHNYGKTPGYMSNVTAGGASIANAIWNQTATSATGGGQSHNNLQPYITVYMWRRTA